MQVNSSLEIILLNIKKKYTLAESSPLVLWSFLENSTKECVKYFLRFNNISFFSWNKNTIKKFNQIAHSFNSTTISNIDFFNIIKSFNIEIDDENRKNISSVYFARNRVAHLMYEGNTEYEETIFNYINKLFIFCSKITIDE